jgi:HEPN domain-containing protein
MKPLTAEWVELAEEDYAAARQLRQARRYNTACFHAQQCAEKYLKAVLCETGMAIERTHQLSDLLNALTATYPMWDMLREATEVLSDHAVRPRYPGLKADAGMAKTAVEASEFIRVRLRQHLGLSSRTRRGGAKKRRGT